MDFLIFTGGFLFAIVLFAALIELDADLRDRARHRQPPAQRPVDPPIRRRDTRQLPGGFDEAMRRWGPITARMGRGR